MEEEDLYVLRSLALAALNGFPFFVELLYCFFFGFGMSVCVNCSKRSSGRAINEKVTKSIRDWRFCRNNY